MTTAPIGTGAVPQADDVDLSVVVCFYDMKREAGRTLHSLSRSYQRGIEDISYEVIAVENGSAAHQRLGAEFVASFGPEFRYTDLGDTASASPTRAMNRGIDMARGRSLALMFDGAHVLTPGVLRMGLLGLATYEPAIVATQLWYVGPGQQSEALASGYDQTYEDRLFEEIAWPNDGYRLFEIGHFVGNRDWFDAMWESNCLFVPRPLLDVAGGYDERFISPGGGFANLDVYERLGSAAGTTIASILGEASFHQMHGGVTTNAVGADRSRRVDEYAAEYAALRGRRFEPPAKSVQFVGALPSQAVRRTRPRRLTARTFAKAAPPLPGPPVPVPDDLKAAFTEAVWRSAPETNAQWLGRPLTTSPTDLLAYQELIVNVRPDWIVEAGADDSGRTGFLASICDLVGHGQIVAIGDACADDPLLHPRVHHVVGQAFEQRAADEVRALVPAGSRALVIIATRARRDRTVRTFEAYAPLVPVGSYVVVADTILNGHPVWPDFGAGPAEAVRKILDAHAEFVVDRTMEKFSLTFNPGGFLRRVR
jgi:cephalosporin hydroxylase